MCACLSCRVKSALTNAQKRCRSLRVILQTSVPGKESVGTQDKESSVLLISYSKNEQS